MVRLIAIVGSLLAIGFLIFGLNPTAKAEIVIGVPCVSIFDGGVIIGQNCNGNIVYNEHYYHRNEHRGFERHDRRDDRRDHRR